MFELRFNVERPFDGAIRFGLYEHANGYPGRLIADIGSVPLDAIGAKCLIISDDAAIKALRQKRSFPWLRRPGAPFLAWALDGHKLSFARAIVSPPGVIYVPLRVETNW